MANGDLKTNEEVKKIKEELNTSLTEKSLAQADLIKSQLKVEISNDLKKEINKLAQSNTKKLEKEVKDYVDKTQYRATEILAIFVALFTFISVNINIFNKVKDLFSASVFMILMAAVLIIFTTPFLFFLQQEDPKNKKFFWIMFLTPILLLLLTLIISKFLNVDLNIYANT